MTADLLFECAEDAEELIIAWMAPLRRSGSARETGDPLPFTIVTQVTGPELPDLGLADPVVSVHTLCDKALGWGAAKNEAKRTHRRMLQLARYGDPITLNGGRQASVDYVTVFESPIWVLYEDTQILRKVGRYTIGLSYVPAETASAPPALVPAAFALPFTPAISMAAVLIPPSPITLVQTATGTTFPLNFTNPVTTGNTVVVLSGVLASGTPVVDTPTFNGSNAAGAYPIWNDGGANAITTVYSLPGCSSIGWVLPDCPTGNGIDFGTKNISYNAGNVAYEVAGLGPTPIINAASRGDAVTTAIDSGSSGNTTTPTFVVGTTATTSVSTGPPAGWITLSPTGNMWAGYQIGSPPNSYEWVQTAGGTAWTAGVAAIAAS